MGDCPSGTSRCGEVCLRDDESCTGEIAELTATATATSIGVTAGILCVAGVLSGGVTLIATPVIIGALAVGPAVAAGKTFGTIENYPQCQFE